jgi:hypothetical protein
MRDPTLKVTDKRMFTPEGELREEVRVQLEEEGRLSSEEPAAAEPIAGGKSQAPSPREPGFYDLLAALAEPAALYLGEATLPDGTLATDLALARVHIGLLEVLQRKTAGNLSADEAAAFDDLLYRLRMRYVQKRD